MVTHKVIDIDTGKVVCTLPITSGGVCPTYRVRVVAVNAAEPLRAADSPKAGAKSAIKRAPMSKVIRPAKSG